MSTHRKEESSRAKLDEIQPNKTQSEQENNEPIKEPSTVLKVANTEKFTEDPKVIIVPPQVDLNTAWKIFVNGAKNSLVARAGVDVVLRIP